MALLVALVVDDDRAEFARPDQRIAPRSSPTRRQLVAQQRPTHRLGRRPRSLSLAAAEAVGPRAQRGQRTPSTRSPGTTRAVAACPARSELPRRAARLPARAVQQRSEPAATPSTAPRRPNAPSPTAPPLQPATNSRLADEPAHRRQRRDSYSWPPSPTTRRSSTGSAPLPQRRYRRESHDWCMPARREHLLTRLLRDRRARGTRNRRRDLGAAAARLSRLDTGRASPARWRHRDRGRPTASAGCRRYARCPSVGLTPSARSGRFPLTRAGALAILALGRRHRRAGPHAASSSCVATVRDGQPIDGARGARRRRIGRGTHHGDRRSRTGGTTPQAQYSTTPHGRASTCPASGGAYASESIRDAGTAPRATQQHDGGRRPETGEPGPPAPGGRDACRAASQMPIPAQQTIDGATVSASATAPRTPRASIPRRHLQA